MALSVPISPAQLTAAVGALLFALGVLLVPWELLGAIPYEDFYVYMDIFQAGSQSVREMYEPETLLEFFTHEVLWDELVRLLVDVTGSPFFALKLISATVLWINAYILYSRFGYLLPTLLLLNPLFLDFALSQLRLALAMALLIVALNVRSRIVRGCLALAALFIHSSVPIFVGLFVVVRYVDKFGQHWSLHRVVALISIVSAGLIFTLAFGRDALLMAMDDRRAFLYAGAYGSTSLLYASFWMGMIIMQLLAGAEYLKRPDNLYATMILILFVGMTLFQTYGSRFLAATFPVVISSALNLPPESRSILLPMFLVFQITQFLYWFGIYIF